MAVRIYLEIGHEASIRTKKTQEGFTHDWEVFVRGCEGAEIQYYVEKVVFYLHETFPKPKRVVKEPPYSVKESGYAGFNLPIDIYLRNNSEPKKIRFNYDLHLQQSGPPIIKVQKEKYIFNSTIEEFKIKLLKGGAILGSSSSIQDVSDSRSSLDDKNQMTNKPKLSGSDFAKKQKMKLGEPCRDFQELFGSPINMTSKIPEQKLPNVKPESKDKNRTKHSPHKEGHKDKEKSKDKPEGEKKSREEKKQKEKSKDRERSKDKSLKKEKSPRPKSPSPKRSPKRSSSPPRFSSPPVIKHKESKHEKEKREKSDDRKSKKEKKNKEHKENKHGEEKTPEDLKDGKNRSERKEETKTKSESSPPPVPKAPEKKEKSKEKSSKETPKEDRHSEKEKYKHKKKDKEKRDKKEDKQYSKPDKKPDKPPAEPKSSLFKGEPPAHVAEKKKMSFVSPVMVPQVVVDDDSSNSSVSSSGSSQAAAERQIEKKPKIESTKVKEEKPAKVKKEKVYQETTTVKCKRKSNPEEVEEPPEKVKKEVADVSSDGEKEGEGKPEARRRPMEMEEDYFSLLRDLQHKIMDIKDNSHLQKVVKLIAETGRYEVSANTFDFDLCLLDRSTVQQLQEFFASET